MAKRVVHFTLTPAGDGSKEYTLSQTSGDPVLDTNRKNGIKVASRHHYYMTFKLGDNSLSFDGDRGRDVFLIRAGDTCPERGEAAENSNFKIFGLKNDGRELEIRNDNVDPGSFSYRILIKQGTQVRDFDPVIINGGGGNRLTWAQILVPILGTVAFVGVAFMFAYAAGVIPK